MSHNLEARSDERYSQVFSRVRIHEILRGIPDIRQNGPKTFILRRGNSLSMDIAVERRDQHGKDIEKGGIVDEVNCVRFHIPDGVESSLEEAITIVKQIGTSIGWPVVVVQTAKTSGSGDKKPWWKFW